MATIAEKLQTIAENQQKVYDAGVEAGKAQGDDSYYDTFWDDFQAKGNRLSYGYAFSNGWGDGAFKPKYDLKPTYAAGMFQYSNITSLKDKLEQLGRRLDTSQASTISQMFQGAKIKDIPIIDASNVTNMSYAFGSKPKVETIEKLILSNKLTNVGNAFGQATELTHVIFEGTIAITGLDLHWSMKLDAESYDSLIKCYDKTKALTLTLPAEETVRSVYDAKYGSGAWDTITAEYSNLTIAYM